MTPLITGVDRAALTAWMDREGLGDGPLSGLDHLAGGTQNILVRFTRGDRDYVLRRPPTRKRANSDETMRREARVLGALRGTTVPCPTLIAHCDDTEVLGAAFYLMAPVDGFTPTNGLPADVVGDNEQQHRLGLSLVEGIAELSRVDVSTPALAGFGRREGWLERQVDRWRSQLDGYAQIPGYQVGSLPHVDPIAGWLRRHRPAQSTAGLLHGDYHFANVMVRHDAPELAAIVDWELSTIGDPLLDLGHLLATWPTLQPPESTLGALNLPGLPAESELVEHYARVSGRDVSHLSWFTVLACFRLAILLEGSRARAMAGDMPQETGRRLGEMARSLLQRARDLIDAP